MSLCPRFSILGYSCSACNFHVHTYCAPAPATVPPSAESVRNDLYVKFVPVGKGDYVDIVSSAGYGVGGVAAAEEGNSSVVLEDPILKAQAEQHELQMQMQIVNEMVKMMASFNLSSLV